MKNVKRMSASCALLAVLSTVAFGGEVPSPPCVPGEVNAPPCTSQSVTNDSTGSSLLETPPVSDSVKLIDLAEEVVWSLLLF